MFLEEHWMEEATWGYISFARIGYIVILAADIEPVKTDNDIYYR